MGSSFSEALAPRDIATMGALCALASLSRPELKRQVVDNLGFREYLEAVPEVGFHCIFFQAVFCLAPASLAFTSQCSCAKWWTAWASGSTSRLCPRSAGSGGDGQLLPALDKPSLCPKWACSFFSPFFSLHFLPVFFIA